jgi:hypothetical protein
VFIHFNEKYSTALVQHLSFELHHHNIHIFPKQTAMQNIIKCLFLGLFLATTWWACKDSDLFDLPYANGNGSLSGQVVDEWFAPVRDALVTVGNASAYTDKNGVFRLNANSLPAENAVFHVEKLGYFEYSRAVPVNSTASSALTIQLIKFQSYFSFSSFSGAEITFDNKVTITFPNNAIANADGSRYDGSVKVVGHYLNPEYEYMALQMPGDLRAVDATGDEKLLATYGMFVVELYGTNNEKLNLLSGQEAEIKQKIPNSLSASAPAVIPLWYFDPSTALWIEDGTAERVGDQYVGKVSHFSWWNCDVPQNFIKLSGKVFIGNSEDPAANALVSIINLDNNTTGSAHIDAAGNFSGFVPKDANLRITINVMVGFCLQAIYTADIGPFGSDTQLPNIIIVPPVPDKVVTVKGKLVDCNQNPLVNGYAMISAVNYSTIAFPDINGDFNISLPVCSDTLQVVGFDDDNLKTSDGILVLSPSGVENVGVVVVCSENNEYFKINVDGVPYWMPTSWGGEYCGAAYNMTMINGEKNGKHIFMILKADGQTGTFKVNYLNGEQIGIMDDATPNLVSTITKYGQKGEYIEGVFSGTMKDSLGQTINIDGAYRAIRKQ